MRCVNHSINDNLHKKWLLARVVGHSQELSRQQLDLVPRLLAVEQGSKGFTSGGDWC